MCELTTATALIQAEGGGETNKRVPVKQEISFIRMLLAAKSKEGVGEICTLNHFFLSLAKRSLQILLLELTTNYKNCN
jgi:hypothetical protein